MTPFPQVSSNNLPGAAGTNVRKDKTTAGWRNLVDSNDGHALDAPSDLVGVDINVPYRLDTVCAQKPRTLASDFSGPPNIERAIRASRLHPSG